MELNIATTAVNLLLGLTLLTIFINQRSDLLKTQIDFLTFAIVLNGLVLSVAANIHYDIFILYFHRTLPYGLCQFGGTLVTLVVAGNQTLHALIAVERYLKIFGSKFKFPATFILVTFSFSMVIAVLAIMWIQGYHVMESEIFCFLDLSSREGLDLAANLILMAFIMVNTLIIIACYGTIYRKVNTEKSEASKTLKIQNQKVAKKFLIISLAYFLAYAPSYTCFLYRFITGSRISKELEYIHTYISLCEPSITYTLLFYLNSNYRKGFQKLLSAWF